MRFRVTGRSIVLAAFLSAASGVGTAAASANFLYPLSDFSGPIRISYPRLHVDNAHGEVYMAHANLIRVFGDSGMELYRFDAAEPLGLVLDLAASEDGDLFVLSRGKTGTDESDSTWVTRCDYRGTPVERLEWSGWPEGLEQVAFDRLLLRGDRLYLASLNELRLVEVDRNGGFLGARDLAEILGISEKDRVERIVQIGGFDVDRSGNLLLTVPVRFQAFVIPPAGPARVFGRPGSAPGMFGIVSGIAAADDGRVFVADRLRCVVLVFDREFRFVEEFGYFGPRPENLEGPGELAIGDGGRLFVAQRSDRGVSVFDVAAR